MAASAPLTHSLQHPIAQVMHFHSDNVARVHPRVWAALAAADAPDAGYDGDRLSQALDEAFSALFGAACAAVWVATGTAANCLALGTMVRPHGGVICHEEAHIEMDEGSAPGFYLHGAKLLTVPGDGAKLTVAAIAARLDAIRPGVHQVQAHAISITQATELGRVYGPGEVAAIGALARARGLGLHMDGARFANAVAHLGADPADLAVRAGVDALSFGFVKNGAMNAEAVVLFDPVQADLLRFQRKRAGHLQSKGRYLAAQILAMLEGDLWLANARAANVAAQELAVACGSRLVQPVEANEVFVVLSPAEAAALRDQGFGFYDWPAPAGAPGAARLVTGWDVRAQDVAALARAIAGL